MDTTKNGYVIAAVRNEEDFLTAVASDVRIIFDLTPNITLLKKRAEAVHKAGKKLFIHLDLAEGIGKDKYGIAFAKEAGIDGIISTRASIIKSAREQQMFTVQRVFLVDSHSVDTTVESWKSSKADMIEIMPGIVPKAIRLLKKKINTPMIAGGLIETEEEVNEAIASGATAVSTGARALWGGEKR